MNDSNYVKRNPWSDPSLSEEDREILRSTCGARHAIEVLVERGVEHANFDVLIGAVRDDELPRVRVAKCWRYGFGDLERLAERLCSGSYSPAPRRQP